MKTTHDLSTLTWTLAGWTPYLWRLLKTLELGESPQAELRGIRAVVPGSVQQALREGKAISTRRDRYDGNGINGEGFHPFFTKEGKLRGGLEFLIEKPKVLAPWERT